MTIEIWVVKGVGNAMPEKETISGSLTVGQFRAKYADIMDVSSRSIEISTATKTLKNDNNLMCKKVDDGETINVIPRSKAGK